MKDEMKKNQMSMRITTVRLTRGEMRMRITLDELKIGAVSRGILRSLYGHRSIHALAGGGDLFLLLGYGSIA